MSLVVFVGCFLLALSGSYGQSIEDKINSVEQEKAQLEKQIALHDQQLVNLTHKSLIADLHKIGLPSSNYIEHSAMILEYDEAHEQAKWVSHIIHPKIETGKEERTDDFRVDPKVTTGTTVQEDYFLSDTMANGKITYDGYGYDRGHLAPCNDFRWSKIATSESFYYSNMSPQHEDFNQGMWLELENQLRKYVLLYKVPLVVVTMPILRDDLPKVKRSLNGVSVPEKFAKAIYDPVNKRGIGFVMENKKLEGPLETYAVSIDDVEEISGLEIFRNVSEDIEARLEKRSWIENLRNGDLEPIHYSDLPKGKFNSAQATYHMGEKVTICGHVVASRFTRKGNLMISFDKKSKNKIFQVFLRKDNLINFDTDIKEKYVNRATCVTGKIEDLYGTPTIFLRNQKNIELFSPNSEEE